MNPGSKIMNGAETPPRRPNMDPKPTPIVRISVEKSSAANTYTAQNDAEIANFPANAHHVAATAVESVSVSDTSKSIIDARQQSPPKIIAPPSKIRRPNRSEITVICHHYLNGSIHGYDLVLIITMIQIDFDTKPNSAIQSKYAKSSTKPLIALLT